MGHTEIIYFKPSKKYEFIIISCNTVCMSNDPMWGPTPRLRNFDRKIEKGCKMRITQGHTGQVLRDLNAVCNPAGLLKVSTTLTKEKLLLKLLHIWVLTCTVLAQLGQGGGWEITFRLAAGQLQRLKILFDHGYICFLFFTTLISAASPQDSSLPSEASLVKILH